MLILELKLRKLRFGEEKTKVVNKYLEKEHGNRRTGTKGDEDNEVGKKRKRLCGIMRWGELGDLAVLLCSLTKVWISQRSTVTLQPSSSRSGRTTRSQSTNKESESVMAERACLPPSLSITANTRRWERERQRERGSHWPQHSPPADDEVTRYGWPSEQVVMCGLKQDMNRVHSRYVCSHRVQCGLCSFGDIKIEYSQLL